MIKVSAFMADGLEEIECLAVVDVLRRADIDVETVSITDQNTVTGSHKITVMTDTVFDQADFENTSMLFLPGGMPGTKNLENCDKLMDLLDRFNARKGWIAAICAAPSVLGKRGLLKGKKATCYPGFENCLEGAEYTGAGVECDGNIITARGLGCAIDLGLEIIGKLKGQAAMETVKSSIQHPDTF